MRLLVVGGKLQGVEACYLARRAGWTTVMVDDSPRPPAMGLCDEFHRFDVTREKRQLEALARACDVVLPAIENEDALLALKKLRDMKVVRVLYDFDAFNATRDKLEFQRRFDDELDMPPIYPCKPPFVVKSRTGSGSHGIKYIESIKDGDPEIEDDDLLVQHYVEGEHWSLEVVRREGITRPYVPALLEFDREFSCSMVFVPRTAPAGVGESLAEMGTVVASGVQLSGLMDVQAIRSSEGMYLLEANARLPSQTPMAVLHAGGANLLEELVSPRGTAGVKKAALLEHVVMRDGRVEVAGERVISTAGPLREERGRWGADTALTDVHGGEGVATLVVTESSIERAARQMAECIRRMVEELNS